MENLATSSHANNSGADVGLCGLAIMTAARELAEETDDISVQIGLRTLADEFSRALSEPDVDPSTLIELGPYTRELSGEWRSLYEMVLSHPGENPIRTAKLLLRAIQWNPPLSQADDAE